MFYGISKVIKSLGCLSLFWNNEKDAMSDDQKIGALCGEIKRCQSYFFDRPVTTWLYITFHWLVKLKRSRHELTL